MHIAIRRIGNSRGIIIPTPLLEQIGLHNQDEAEVSVKDGSLIVRAPAQPARSGWAEASQALAMAGDDIPVLPEFGNDEDAEHAW